MKICDNCGSVVSVGLCNNCDIPLTEVQELSGEKLHRIMQIIFSYESEYKYAHEQRSIPRILQRYGYSTTLEEILTVVAQHPEAYFIRNDFFYARSPLGFVSMDMHNHTTYSDGKCTPRLLTTKLVSQVDFFAITDHDSIEYHLEPKATGVSAVEIACFVKIGGIDYPIELLSYRWHPARLDMLTDGILRGPRVSQERLFKELQQRVLELGCQIDEAEFPTSQVYAHAAIFELLSKYPTNHEILGELLEGNNDVFYRLAQTEGSPLYVAMDKFYPDYADVAAYLRKAGGISFLAHPCRNKNMWDIIRVVTPKIDGIECVHPSYPSRDESIKVIEYCKQHNLLATLGSDYHEGLYTPPAHQDFITQYPEMFAWL